MYQIRTEGKSNIVYITEGIADSISIHEATGDNVLSPVTARFKKSDFDNVAHRAKCYQEVIIVNDNEGNESGEKGAVNNRKRNFGNEE